MEQVTIGYIKELLKNNELKLFSTQSKLCIPIVKRMYQKMLKGIKFDDIKVCDNLIIDGHHRYVSSLLAKYPINSVTSSKTSATMFISRVDVTFDENDWDTTSKISHLNEQDARYNNVDIEILNQITSTLQIKP